MKIRCSQTGGGGQPPRHEVSHFHPVVGSPPPPEGGRTATGGHGSSKGRGSGGSHRRDRQIAKDRAKDRALVASSDKQPAIGGLTGPAAVVVVSRDVLLDSSKTVNADGLDRDGSSTAALPTPICHDPYEFSASSEDSISCPTKKLKLEQVRRAFVYMELAHLTVV